MAQESEEYKGVIFSIEENYEASWKPASGPNAGQELFKHKVIVVQDGTKNKVEGVFFQRTKELMFNKEKCYHGQEICFTSKPPKREGNPMTFTMCNDKGAITQEIAPGVADVSRVSSFAFSYSKDIWCAFGNKDLTPQEALAGIKEMSIDIKNHLLGN